ncbi:hypothetical protein SLS62_003548 [Diatrype stigma]|uniref:L-ornithine N(5)-monooxygenase [NAD(P)H] n=1 Tax=Diatrype stigma TaxID=117547 RepID=A0AAN9UUU5_9PEZI
MAPHIDDQLGGPENQPHNLNSSPLRNSHLHSTSSEDVHDLICVGFGPASLAVAVALHDFMEAGKIPKPGNGAGPKVLFLEKQRQFAWHAGMLLPGAKMQISFIKDMASLRDPTSKFTFLNYLHQNDRLVEFTNLSTFLPARVEYEDYLRWCASHFTDVVRYENEVVSVSPAVAGRTPVSNFSVTSKNVRTGATTTYRTKNVLVAIGGQPSIPKSLPSNHPRVVHSSQYAHLVPKILTNRDAPYRVAVVGAGQSAAEIFNNIQTLYPNSRTSLVMRSEFLKPSDDSPFVNSIFNPSYVDSLFARTAESRRAILADARATNYGVVRLELIEHLYERMYDQRRELGPDERKWPHRLRPATDVVRLEDGPSSSRLRIRPLGASSDVEDEVLEVDLVIAATGYRRSAHLTMMEGVEALLPAADQPLPPAVDAAVATATNGSGATEARPTESKIGNRPVRVGRDYGVKFAPGKVAAGSGIWLQGCCEGTHGLSDTLLSILSVRSGEIINSVFKEGRDVNSVARPRKLPSSKL